MNLRHYDGSLTKAGVALGLIVFALIFIAIWAVVEVAFGADVDCMSKEQARSKYPKQVIYWHTANRCWNNIPARKVSRMPVPQIDASGNATPRRVTKPTASGPSIFYLTLMGGGGTSDDMLAPYPVIEWQPITDFDKDPPPFLPWERVSALLNK